MTGDPPPAMVARISAPGMARPLSESTMRPEMSPCVVCAKDTPANAIAANAIRWNPGSPLIVACSESLSRHSAAQTFYPVTPYSLGPFFVYSLKGLMRNALLLVSIAALQAQTAPEPPQALILAGNGATLIRAG